MTFIELLIFLSAPSLLTESPLTLSCMRNINLIIYLHTHLIGFTCTICCNQEQQLFHDFYFYKLCWNCQFWSCIILTYVSNALAPSFIQMGCLFWTCHAALKYCNYSKCLSSYLPVWQCTMKILLASTAEQPLSITHKEVDKMAFDVTIAVLLGFSCIPLHVIQYPFI